MIMINNKKENKICKLFDQTCIYVTQKNFFSIVKNANSLNLFKNLL